jgi:uncharacterized membrane protein YkvA (DUF1232 family)
MRIRDWIIKKSKEIKGGILMISIAYRHPDIGFMPRILAFLTLAYALSPIDLIPDFIPILGLLDDLVILPLLIFLTIKSIPDDVLREARIASENEEGLKEKKWTLVPIIIGIWTAIAFFAGRAIVMRIRTG